MKFANVIHQCLCAGLLSVAAAAAWAGNFSVSTDGQELTDVQNNLVWRRCAEGMNWNGSTCTGSASVFTHEAALQRAAAEAANSGRAWRLPNIKELTSIVDRTRRGPAIDPTAFPATPIYLFWSGTPVFSNTASVSGWAVSFGDGGVGYSSRLSHFHVRLVRASQ